MFAPPEHTELVARLVVDWLGNAQLSWERSARKDGWSLATMRPPYVFIPMSCLDDRIDGETCFGTWDRSESEIWAREVETRARLISPWGSRLSVTAVDFSNYDGDYVHLEAELELRS